MTMRGWLRRRRFRRLLIRAGFGMAVDQPPLEWQEMWRRGSTFVLLSMLSSGEVEAEVSRATPRGMRGPAYVYSTADLSMRVKYR